MAMGSQIPYYAKHSGDELDKVIEYVLKLMDSSTSDIIDSDPVNKIDLNTVIEKQGTFTIEYYTNSYDDTQERPIDLRVAFIGNTMIVQRYEFNAVTVQRTYTVETEEWSEWAPVKSFVVADETEEIHVDADTLVFRGVASADKFFEEKNEEATS